MSVTVKVNGTANSLAHKGNSGFAQSTIPDVCKTPSPGGPVPIPYPVIVSMSADLAKGSQTVKADGGNMIAIKGSELTRCTGDEPGTAGGVKSSTNMKEATWILYSFDVKIEGKNACRLSDKMFMNHENTACLSGYFVKPTNLSAADSKLWDECSTQHDKYKATQTEQAAMVDTDYNTLHQSVHSGGPMQHRLDYAEKLEKRLKVVERLHKERKKYIDMGCDKFDWSGAGTTTRAQREAAHRGELNSVSDSITNLRETLQRVRP